MRIRFLRLAFLLSVVAALGLSRTARAQEQAPPQPFWTGADLSLLPLHERQGVKYSDEAGEADLLVIAKRNGWNMVRVRLWVDPDRDKPECAVSNLENVTSFGRRLRAAKLAFLLDIHYSDTWADPGQQRKPKAWEALRFDELQRRVRDYSRSVITTLRENGALPDMVQIGNETRNGLLYGSGTNGSGAHVGGGFWEKTPGGRERAVQLLQAGLDGVWEGAAPAKSPKCILHLPDGQDPDFTSAYFRDLFKTAKSQNIALDFDVLGLSYYPAAPWDEKVGFPGWTLSRLAQSMNTLATTYGKPIMIVETDWPYRGDIKPMPGTPEFAFTPEGQAAFYGALIRAVKAVPNGLGIGVLPWNQDSLTWQSVFDDKGRALPAVRVLGQRN